MQKENERQALINNNNNSSHKTTDNHQYKTSHLEWVESSWTRYFYILCWSWVYPILSLGYKQKLSENDLDDIPHIDKSSILLHRLNSYTWTSTTTTISMIVIKEFWKDFIYAGLYFIPYLLVRIIQPLLLRQIVLNIMNDDKSKLNTYLCMICLFICALSHAFFRRLNYFFPTRVGIQIRNALSLFIYTRALSMKSTAWQQINTGQIINLIIHDTSKFEDACKYLHYLWGGPLETLIIFIILCWIIQPIPALCGYALFPLFILIQLYFSRKFGQYQEKTALYSDRRIHAFNEFIHGSYVIKMSNWEKLIEDRIRAMREDELISIKRTSRLRAINMTQFFVSTPLLALTTFGSAWLLGYPLNPADTFTTLSFFAVMRVNVMYCFPAAIEMLSGVKSASKRIDSFIRLTMEQQQQQYQPQLSAPLMYQQEKGSIILSDASFSWNEDKVCLSSMNLTIQPKTLVGIVGAVGSGKSSLLAAILGELNLLHGQQITDHNRFAYVSQTSWIFADTIRNNILLNQAFNERLYRDVIYACCLDVDLNSFGVTGDLTIMGEKGVNLSGGQKARVSLARALYADADVYLLDDPLAAVDSVVAKQIYERCLGPHGLLKHKTRLLVTHQTQYLSEAHQIICLSSGHIDQQDSSNENSNKEEMTNKNKSSVLASMFDENTSTVDVQPIVTEETSVNGGVSWSIWCRLFTAPPYGKSRLCLLIILLLLGEILYDGSNYWLSLWVQRSHVNEQRSAKFAYILLGLTVATVLTDIVRVNYYFSVILNGSNHLHNNMLKGLLYTSIEFFESNPSGRILNRVSKDQKIIDEVLPITLLHGIVMMLMTTGSLIIICYIHPYISLVIIVLIPVFWFLIRFYLRSSRQLKRLESITRSPVYALFSSSLNGLSTIRAFKAQDHFIELLTKKMDVNTCAYMYVQGAANWIAVRIDTMCCLVILAICLQVVLFPSEMQPSAVAFSLMSAISLILWFQWVVRQFFEVDILVTSVERVDEYAQLPCEEDEGSDQRVVKTSPKWPMNGIIEFKNYSLRHRSNLQYVLKNINLRIESGQRIGIIGRTGAGKSSLFKGMFRCISRLNIDGQILVDDVDISRVTLKHLRSHLGIIPQQSILFSGTLRYNLDPLNQYTDEQCWMTLDDVQLKQFVNDHSDGLLMPIAESGNNLSVGQCQLICIARAILKKSKILMIDEATANVDQKIDDIIQEVITNKFQDRTVIIIAHRLNTVAKSDRILVLDNGIMANYDTPVNVLQHYQ